MKWAKVLSPSYWIGRLSSGQSSAVSSLALPFMAASEPTSGTFTNPPPGRTTESTPSFASETPTMKTLTAIIPHPETLALERHIITLDETAGMNHSINGVHRASSAPEHGAAYLEALPFADQLKEVA